MSVFGGKADENRRKTDLADRMSALGGKADVPATWPGSPMLANSGLQPINNLNIVHQ